VFVYVRARGVCVCVCVRARVCVHARVCACVFVQGAFVAHTLNDEVWPSTCFDVASLTDRYKGKVLYLYA